MHDVKLLAATLDLVVRARLAPRTEAPQHLCADAGYKRAPARQAVKKRHYRPHIKQRREEAEAKRKRPRYKGRRWVVERPTLETHPESPPATALSSFGGPNGRIEA
jgi:IS5 family transposase